MKSYIVYNSNGKILRTGACGEDALFVQAGNNEFVIEGEANDVTQKVANPGIAGKIVNKTPEEIEAEKPSVKPESEQLALITNGQYQDILDRLEVLESEV